MSLKLSVASLMNIWNMCWFSLLYFQLIKLINIVCFIDNVLIWWAEMNQVICAYPEKPSRVLWMESSC